MIKLRFVALALLTVVFSSFSVSETASAQTSLERVGAPYSFDEFRATRPNQAPVVTALAIADAGESIFVGGDDQKIYRWDSATNEFVPLFASKRVERGDPMDDWVRNIALNPKNPDEIATLSQSGQLVVWSVKRNAPLYEAANPVDVSTGYKIRTGAHALAYSPDGSRIAVCSFAPEVRFYEATGLKPIRSVSGSSFVLSAPGESCTTIAYSPDGKALAAAGRDGVVRVWIMPNGKFDEEAASVDLNLVNSELSAFPGQKRRARALCFSSDSALLAVAGDADQILVWDLRAGGEGLVRQARTQNPLKRLLLNFSETSSGSGGRKVFSMTFCGANKLATGDSVNDVCVWNVDAEKIDAIGAGYHKGDPEPVGHSGTVAALVYDPVSQTLFSGGFDAKVIRWNLK